MRWALFFLLCCAVAPAFAQALVDRDPTRPIDYKGLGLKNAEAPQSGLTLRAILIGEKRRHALINNRYVKVGDVIGSAKVITIKKGSVTLEDSGRKITLRLFEHTIRK